jgi:hypothetical protein
MGFILIGQTISHYRFARHPAATISEDQATVLAAIGGSQREHSERSGRVIHKESDTQKV